MTVIASTASASGAPGQPSSADAVASPGAASCHPQPDAMPTCIDNPSTAPAAGVDGETDASSTTSETPQAPASAASEPAEVPGAPDVPEDPEAAAEQAAREAAEAAEKARVEAEELAERRAYQAEVAEEQAERAVETIASSAGFVTRAGVYYDVKAAANAQTAAREAARAAASARAAAAAAEAAVPTAAADAPEEPQAPVASEAAAPEAPEDPDACDAPDEGTYVDDAAFARQVAKLTEAVARQSLHREILYKVLVYCEESRPLQDIEHEITTYAAFKHAANNPYHFIQVLEHAGGLERFELDDEGEVVTADRKEGLTEDEVDDLVAGYAFMTTPVGMAVVEQHTPRARIIELLDLVPERKDAYIELLEFCSEDPRTYNEVSQLFKGRDVLVRMVDGEPQTMQPSVFIDKLEAAGGIEWRDGWVLTEEGRSFLAELHEL